jgi:hypothetical protein
MTTATLPCVNVHQILQIASLRCKHIFNSPYGARKIAEFTYLKVAVSERMAGSTLEILLKSDRFFFGRKCDI